LKNDRYRGYMVARIVALNRAHTQRGRRIVMLKELASISIGMLVFGGHITDAKALRQLAGAPQVSAQPATPNPHQAAGRRTRTRDRNASLETVALAMTAGGSFLCVAFGVFALISGQAL
jgi:hypothetical protein